MLRMTAKIKRKSDVPYIGVYLIAISNSGYYIYAAKLFWILVPSYCIKIYIQISRSSGPLKEKYKKYSKIPL